MRQDYLDIFEGIKSNAMHTAQYDENIDIGTAYFGMPKLRRQDVLKAEHQVPITKDCYIPNKLLDDPCCKILLDTGVRKSSMSQMFYLN